MSRCYFRRSFLRTVTVLCFLGVVTVFSQIVYDAVYNDPENEIIRSLHESVKDSARHKRVLSQSHIETVKKQRNISLIIPPLASNTTSIHVVRSVLKKNIPGINFFLPKVQVPAKPMKKRKKYTSTTATTSTTRTSTTIKSTTTTMRTTTTEDPLCPKSKTIFYLKVHKTGSTSFKNVLDRFALEHQLKPLLFTNVDTFPDKDIIKHLVPIKSYLKLAKEESIENILLNENLMNNLVNKSIIENQCDLIDTHVVFNESVVRLLLRGQPKFLASVRHPLAQLKSAAHQFGLYDKLGVSGYDDPLEEFLKQPHKYDKNLEFYYHPEYRISYTKNFMAYTFGFDLTRQNNTKYVEEFLMYVNKTFDHVIIAEDFVSSMVVLKNKLCWNFKDVLFLEHREQLYKYKKKPVSKKAQETHEQWTHVDYKLYEMFLQRHKNEVSELGNKYWHDVYILRYLSKQAAEFCRKICVKGKILADKVTGFGLSKPYEYFDPLFEKLLVKKIVVKHIDNFVMTIDGDDCLTMSLYDHYMEWIVLARTYPELCDPENVTLLSDLGVVILSKVNCARKGAKTLRNGIPYEVFQDTEAFLSC